MLNIKERAQRIKCLIIDVDGVLTDGKIIYCSSGGEIKCFDVQDGLALVLFKKAGLNTAIITARASKVVKMRAKDLRINEVYENSFNKYNAYKKILGKFNLNDSQVCFIGDSLLDICVLKHVGLAIAVSNAAPEVKRVCHYVTNQRGGNGAIREIVELILKSQGKWKKILKSYQ